MGGNPAKTWENRQKSLENQRERLTVEWQGGGWARRHAARPPLFSSLSWGKKTGKAGRLGEEDRVSPHRKGGGEEERAPAREEAGEFSAS